MTMKLNQHLSKTVKKLSIVTLKVLHKTALAWPGVLNNLANECMILVQSRPKCMQLHTIRTLDVSLICVLCV